MFEISRPPLTLKVARTERTSKHDRALLGSCFGLLEKKTKLAMYNKMTVTLNEKVSFVEIIV